MPLLNYTGHKVTYCAWDGRPIHTYEPQGEVRINTIKEKVTELDTIPIFKHKTNILKGLPPQIRGTYYIVSRIAAENMKAMGRQDMYCLGTKVEISKDNVGFKNLIKL